MLISKSVCFVYVTVNFGRWRCLCFNVSGSPDLNRYTTGSEKTIMLIGATGTGKSTLVDGFVNYVLGVKWDDSFRFKVVDLEEEEKSKEKNQVNLCRKQHTCLQQLALHLELWRKLFRLLMYNKLRLSFNCDIFAWSRLYSLLIYLNLSSKLYKRNFTGKGFFSNEIHRLWKNNASKQISFSFL